MHNIPVKAATAFGLRWTLRDKAPRSALYLKRWATMSPLLIVIVALTLLAPIAHADCGSKDKILFSCVTTQGKKIEVCNFGHTIQYAFGKSKLKPELKITVPISKVTGMSCYTCGRYTNAAVFIPNRNITYNVFWGNDKLSETGKTEGGVEVIISGESKARIACASEPIINNSEGITFKEPEVVE